MTPYPEHEALLTELLADGADDRVERRLTRITEAFRTFVVLRSDPESGRLREEIDRAINHGDYRRAVFDEQNPQNARELLLAQWRRLERGELDMAAAVQEGLARRREDERFARFNDWYDLADNLRQKDDLAAFAPLAELMNAVIPPDFARLCWFPTLAVNAGTAIALSHLAAGRDEAAAATAERWAREAEQVADRNLISGACGLWLLAGDTHDRAGRAAEAERCYRGAVTASQHGAPPGRRVECLVALGRFLAHAGRGAEGRQPLEEAVAVDAAENLADSAARHDVLLARAELALADRDVPAALAALAGGIGLLPQQPAGRWNRCLHDLRVLVAQVTYDTGSELADLLPGFLEMVEARDPEGRVPGVRSTLYSSLGHALRNRGDLQGAVDAYASARDAARRDGDEMHAARWDANIGQLYMILNRAAEAEKILLRSSSALARHNDHSGAANQQMNVGHLYRAEGRLDVAEQAYADAFVLFGQAGRRADLGIAAGALGQIHRARGDLDRAEAAARYFARKAEETGSDRFRATARGELAGLLAVRGNAAGAVAEYTEAITEAERAGVGLLELQLRMARGRLYEQGGGREEAEADYRRALALLDSSRGGLRSYDDRASFQLQSEAAGGALVSLLAGQPGREAAAFEAAERARSRALLDDLSRSPFHPPPDVPTKLAEEERGLLAELRQKERTGSASAEQYDRLSRQLAGVWDRIRATPSESARAYVAFRQTPETAYRSALVAAGTRQVLLVEYFLTDDRVLLFGLRTDHPEPLVRSLRVNPGDLTRWAQDHFGSPGARAALPRFFRTGGDRRLQEMLGRLVEPVADLAEPGDMVYLVPHRDLHRVPLHAVELPGRGGREPLIERNPVAYAPSAAALAYLRARQSRPPAVRPRPAAVFGNPTGDLAYSELEADVVARQFGVNPLCGTDVNPKAFRDAAAGASVVHYCGHAAADPVDPLASGLLLAGGRFTARDVLEMPDLTAELVTLNGCETGVNQPGPGDELFGLARAFLLGGATSALVNLWQTDDVAGAGLLSRFYAEWQAAPDRGTAEALRRAVRTARGLSDRTLYHWAPFLLIGNCL
jgi:tetratricopeptide (TPR) repeat protein